MKAILGLLMRKIINIFYFLFLFKDGKLIIRNDGPNRNFNFKINSLLSNTKNKEKFMIFLRPNYTIRYNLLND